MHGVFFTLPGLAASHHVTMVLSATQQPPSCLPWGATFKQKEGPQGHCSVERCHKKAFTATRKQQRAPSVYVKKVRSLALGLGGWDLGFGQCVDMQESPRRAGKASVMHDDSVKVT